MKTQLPLFEPDSNWRPPSELPNFHGSKFLGFDVETRDPELRSHGPGFIRNKANVVGISLANEDGLKVYLPFGHDDRRDNLDKNLIKRYVKDMLSDPNSIKVGANVLYDSEALKVDLDIDVVGKVLDILVAEPLIDENQKTYNLDRLGEHYEGRGKNYKMLDEALNSFFGKKGNRGDIWRLPARYVGSYAEDDAMLPVEIIQKQLKKLDEEGLMKIFEIETDVTQILLYMRLKGVPVDVSKAQLVIRDLKKKEQEAQEQLNRMAGLKVNVWAGQDVARAFDSENIPYLKTKQGNPSFEKKWLQDHPSHLAKLIVKVRTINRIWSTFIQGTVLGHHVNGRVHCQFHQLKSDDGGTITGRFSSSNPNLQQVPARDEELAPIVRGLFIPEEGCDWHCDDYSQIEPRLQVHYAHLMHMPGAKEAAEKYIRDPSTDFHQMTADLTGLPRKPAKNIHLGISYGMGVRALAGHLGVSEEEAKKLRAQYNDYMPFLDGISRAVNNRAAQVGFIRTILGRKGRFDQWEPAGFDRRGFPKPTRQEALDEYGPPVRRADTRKAFNKLIQGSAADVIKKAMVDIWRSGVLQYSTMHLTVHDELDFSIPHDNKEVGDEIVHLMSTCIDCSVPLKVDNEVGPSWGEAE